MHGSLLTFGNDTPLYGHPTGGLALTDMYVIHTGYSHNTSLQNQGYMEGGSGGVEEWRRGEQPEQWKILYGGGSKQSWRGCPGKGGGDAIHSFIHPSSFIFSLLVVVICRFEVKGGWGGGTVGYKVVQYSEGRGCEGFPACHSR